MDLTGRSLAGSCTVVEPGQSVVDVVIARASNALFNVLLLLCCLLGKANVEPCALHVGSEAHLLPYSLTPAKHETRRRLGIYS
jgi:hypothetical protein